MSVYKRGETYWYKFSYAGQPIRESAKTTSKTIAKEAEQKRKRELQEGFNDVRKDTRKQRVRTIAAMFEDYMNDYRVHHPDSFTFVEYTARHVVRLLGMNMLIDINAETVTKYQSDRLREAAAASTVNGEVGLLLRVIGERGDLLKLQLKRKKQLNLPVRERIGQAYSIEQSDSLLTAAEKSSSNYIRLALRLAMNSGTRIKEMRTLRWKQIDFEKRILTVGRTKTAAGDGRTVTLNPEAMSALFEYARWYAERFGELKPEWFIFPAERGNSLDPERSVSSLQYSWTSVRRNANVQGRWHDHRHTLITELAENGAGDETIMSLVGHVSKRMLKHYSHIRTEAKRRALDQVLKSREEQRLANAEKRAAEAAVATGTVN